MITIGYQGISGSNSEEAAKQLAETMELKNYKLMPLVSSINVLSNIEVGNIEYGVIAVKNSSGGLVEESYMALLNSKLRLINTITLPIHHFLYVKDGNVKVDDLNQIASHPQAFKQCKNKLQSDYFKVTLFNDEDTATAAKKLSLGLFSRNTGVLCRKNAGEMNQLYLLDSNLEDRDDNTTDFEMYSK